MLCQSRVFILAATENNMLCVFYRLNGLWTNIKCVENEWLIVFSCGDVEGSWSLLEKHLLKLDLFKFTEASETELKAKCCKTLIKTMNMFAKNGKTLGTFKTSTIICKSDEIISQSWKAEKHKVQKAT